MIGRGGLVDGVVQVDTDLCQVGNDLRVLRQFS
jgi:hypothetical protein